MQSPFQLLREDADAAFQAIDVEELISRSDWTIISCADPMSSENEMEPAENECRIEGGILKVFDVGKFQEFFEARAGQAVELRVHVGCVAAYNLGYTTIRDQENLWTVIKEMCQAWADHFECSLDYQIHYGGGAYEALLAN